MCVYIGGKKKKNKRTGVEKRWEKKGNSCFQAEEAADIPRGKCSVKCLRQHNLSVGQTGVLTPVLSDSKIHVLFTVNTM